MTRQRPPAPHPARSAVAVAVAPRPAPGRRRAAAGRWFVAACLALAVAHATARPLPPPHPDHRGGAAAVYGRRDDVMQFADELARERGLDARWLRATLAQARRTPAVQRLIMPAASAAEKNWQAYRARFVEPRRIDAGVAFWNTHAAWLERAQQRYGVPPEVVVGVIGVETYYGRQMGRFRVLDALATLAFDFPTGRSDRSAFFRDELGRYLEWVRREGLPPTRVLGSFAGAIGLGQFMPGSILEHAVDFDGDGHVDMGRNAADVIGSIAAFLSNHGWTRDMATDFTVQAPPDDARRAALLAPDIEPTYTPAQMAEQGAQLDACGRAHAGTLALVELRNGTAAPSYLAGTRNFQVLTTYNRSAYYAAAVIGLGRAVAARRASRAAADADPPGAAAAPGACAPALSGGAATPEAPR